MIYLKSGFPSVHGKEADPVNKTQRSSVPVLELDFETDLSQQLCSGSLSWWTGPLSNINPNLSLYILQQLGPTQHFKFGLDRIGPNPTSTASKPDRDVQQVVFDRTPVCGTEHEEFAAFVQVSDRRGT